MEKGTHFDSCNHSRISHSVPLHPIPSIIPSARWRSEDDRYLWEQRCARRKMGWTTVILFICPHFRPANGAVTVTTIDDHAALTMRGLDSSASHSANGTCSTALGSVPTFFLSRCQCY
ncbi:hypothetical protein J6590_064729 [Homalodisca vitripennis]|nr:hypothetical protein J6590_064729 [Homalodisca vitripennis]